MRLEDYPEALSSSQVGELLGISRVHAWRLITSGELPSFQLGKLNRVPRAAIEHLLRHQTLEGFAAPVPTATTTGPPSAGGVVPDQTSEPQTATPGDAPATPDKAPAKARNGSRRGAGSSVEQQDQKEQQGQERQQGQEGPEPSDE